MRIFFAVISNRLSGAMPRIVQTSIVVVLTAVLGAAALDESPGIFLIGDSTMADKPLTGNPERGWGQVFPCFFKEGTVIENYARNGRSTKSFLAEGRWDAVVQRLHAGDYVLIQFGHNDAKKEDSTRYAAPRAEYMTNLRRFVTETRMKNAIPVLLTPVCRRRFDAEGKFYDVHGEYPAVVRELGEELNVPVIDLNKKSFEWFSRLGVEETKRRFLWVEAGMYSALPNGKRDDTHFVSLGAVEVARLVVEEMQRLHLPLTALLRKDEPEAFVGIGKSVLLDCYYNNEWKKDGEGRLVRFHYIWDDTANSGFSQLAQTIANTGAVIDTLCQPPTLPRLQRASIYIIVDPDTPRETEQPHVIEHAAADAITEWVHAGGVLLLLGNDKGNAEFEHLNHLAERFGIHFNEDSRNRVIGTAFATGTFEKLPDHPLFKSVRKVFIKELSTLRVQAPAQPVLTDSGDVIVAFARYGKGGVFAVGDPWFYNEYMGRWRLPEGYDNARAAVNLFRWLLSEIPESRWN